MSDSAVYSANRILNVKLTAALKQSAEVDPVDGEEFDTHYVWTEV